MLAPTGQQSRGRDWRSSAPTPDVTAPFPRPASDSLPSPSSCNATAVSAGRSAISLLDDYEIVEVPAVRSSLCTLWLGVYLQGQGRHPHNNAGAEDQVPRGENRDERPTNDTLHPHGGPRRVCVVGVPAKRRCPETTRSLDSSDDWSGSSDDGASSESDYCTRAPRRLCHAKSTSELPVGGTGWQSKAVDERTVIEGVWDGAMEYVLLERTELAEEAIQIDNAGV